MIYVPERVLLFGFLVYLAVFLIAPLQPTVPIEPWSFVFIGFSVVAFVLGSRFANTLRIKRRRIPVEFDCVVRSCEACESGCQQLNCA